MKYNIQPYEHFLKENQQNDPINRDDSAALISGFLQNDDLKKLLPLNEPIKSIEAISQPQGDNAAGSYGYTQNFLINKKLKIKASIFINGDKNIRKTFGDKSEIEKIA
jgi:hypothetical protein